MRYKHPILPRCASDIFFALLEFCPSPRKNPVSGPSHIVVHYDLIKNREIWAIYVYVIYDGNPWFEPISRNICTLKIRV